MRRLVYRLPERTLLWTMRYRDNPFAVMGFKLDIRYEWRRGDVVRAHEEKAWNRSMA